MSSRDLLVVPVGSWEQHGPHLPFDTDTRIAIELAQRVVATRSDAVLGPALTVTASGEHSGFPGTLSAGTETTAALMIEIVRSATWAQRVVFVNGHGGNADAIEGARRVLGPEGHQVQFWSPPLEDECDTHAGRIETSVMLALAPDLVRVDRLQAGVCEPISTLMARLRTDGLRAVSPTGVLGDPRSADATIGSALLDRWTSALLTSLDRGPDAP